MLELGVTPSHVSIAVGDDEVSDMNADSAEEESTYCIPLESLGLGGNLITCTGATMLASGLKTNTSESLLELLSTILYLTVQNRKSLITKFI